MLNAHKITG